MTALHVFIIAFFALWNFLVFLLYGYDKWASVDEEETRVSESTLLVCAAMFGALGALAAMTLFHHKTRKAKFRTFIPAFLFLQIFLFFLLIFFGQMIADSYMYV